VKRETEGSDLCSPQARRQGKKKGGKSPFFLKKQWYVCTQWMEGKKFPPFFLLLRKEKESKSDMRQKKTDTLVRGGRGKNKVKNTLFKKSPPHTNII